LIALLPRKVSAPYFVVSRFVVSVDVLVELVSELGVVVVELELGVVEPVAEPLVEPVAEPLMLPEALPLVVLGVVDEVEVDVSVLRARVSFAVLLRVERLHPVAPMLSARTANAAPMSLVLFSFMRIFPPKFGLSIYADRWAGRR
jgi:hypothetical protein